MVRFGVGMAPVEPLKIAGAEFATKVLLLTVCSAPKLWMPAAPYVAEFATKVLLLTVNVPKFIMPLNDSPARRTSSSLSPRTR